jgi:DNA-binding transcriptional LysR family regulator
MAELDANDLVLFARIAETGSFSRAAERMRLPRSTVSRRIAGLEKRLGERLIQRSTRNLSITDFGIHLLEHARALAAEVDGAVALAQHRQAKPSGRLRVSLPGDFTTISLPGMLAEFVRKYPAITLEMDLSPRRVDLIGENYDVVVRLGALTEDSQLAARKLLDITAGLYAAPAYLKAVGAPEKPEDLHAVHGLMLMTLSGEPRPWVIQRGNQDKREKWQGIPKQYTAANSPATLMCIAQAGVGTVTLPDFLAKDAVRRRSLVRVLPEWSAPPVPCWAVFPGRRLMPARTRVFLDALVAGMQSAGAGPKR